jgi:site-specific DNA recombinase
MIHSTGVRRVAVYYRDFTETDLSNAQIVNQVNHIRDFCNQRDWKTVHTFVDRSESGSMLDKVMEFATDPSNNISAIACHKISHISHSFKNLMVLIEEVLTPKGISLISVTENFDTGTLSGRLLLEMISDFSELGKETTPRSCQEEDHTGKAKSNKFVGGIPYGYVVDGGGAFIVDADKAAIVTEMFKSRAEGDSLQRIADSLNKRGVKSGRGGDWNKQGIAFILQNRAYVGEYHSSSREHGEMIYKIPRIIRKQLFYKINGRE